MDIKTLLASSVLHVSAFKTCHLFTVTTINIPCWLPDMMDLVICAGPLFAFHPLVFNSLFFKSTCVFTLPCFSLSCVFLSVSEFTLIIPLILFL